MKSAAGCVPRLSFCTQQQPSHLPRSTQRANPDLPTNLPIGDEPARCTVARHLPNRLLTSDSFGYERGYAFAVLMVFRMFARQFALFEFHDEQDVVRCHNRKEQMCKFMVGGAPEDEQPAHVKSRASNAHPLGKRKPGIRLALVEIERFVAVDCHAEGDGNILSLANSSRRCCLSKAFSGSQHEQRNTSD